MTIFLIIFCIFILIVAKAVSHMLVKDYKTYPIRTKEIEKVIKETDPLIFKWYENKLNITSKSRGKVYRSLVMGLYLHKTN